MFEIYITFSGKDHGVRRWPAVPRTGEHIVVDVDGETRHAEVTGVLWGVTEASRRGGNGPIAVEVSCKLLPKRRT